MKKRVMMAMLVAMGVAGSAFAATTIGYAGQLRDADGKALTELNQRITFALYNTPSGGVAFWKAERNVVLSREGYFNVELEDDNPSVSPSLEEVLQQNSTLYIGLTPKGAAAEIAPRQRILETPHAAVASAGVNGFKVSGTATVTTLAATTANVTTANVTTVNVTNVIATASVTAPTVKAVAIRQQYVDGTEVLYGELLPKGVIVMWNGTEDEIPVGWALCNGKKYGDLKTPDLRDRFVVGAGSKYGVGDTGGEETHKLTVAEMPAHNHGVNKVAGGLSVRSGGEENYTDFMEAEKGTGWPVNPDTLIKEAGGDQAHENRPPYYALCYIIKL